jgi:excisionase family DNA binding protein
MDPIFENRNNLFQDIRLLKPGEVAALLNISRSFAYHLLETGAIPTVRLGKVCRVRPQDLEIYIQQNLHRRIDSQ